MFNFDVLVDGRPVKRYYDRNGHIWIEGRKGTAFTLRVKNNFYNRILGIVSVDGLNVIDGKHVPKEDSRGYVINSYSSVNVPGWKINEDEVREFYFTINGENSYVRKIGADEKNIGVIAAAVYNEKIHWYTTSTTTIGDPWSYPYKWDYGTTLDGSNNIFTCSTSNIGVSDSSMSVNSDSGYVHEMSSGPSVEKVSVGSGERIDFRTTSVDFEKGVYAGEVIIYYDTWEGLKQKGILREDRDYRHKPQPFGSGNYCPDV